MRIHTGLCLGIAALLWWHCSTQSPTAAGGTDYPNTRTIAGVVTDSDGRGLQDAQVVLLATHARDGKPYAGIDTTRTDTDGAFSFSFVPTGVYALEARDAANELVGFHDSVTKTADSLAVFDTLALHKAGSLSGTLVVRQTVDVTVRLDRTPYVAVPDSNGHFRVPSLPPGTYDLRVTAIDTGEGLPPYDTVMTGIAVGDDTLLSEPITLPLLYRTPVLKRFRINTTRNGAHLTEDLYGFPVAVRLDSYTIPFSAVEGDGADVGCTDRFGNPVPFQIEQWDSAGEQAAIWIHLDTLHADTILPLYLFGGERAYPAFHDGSRVFDTANGFQAVYHLAEEAEGVGASDVYRDATAYGAHGIDSVSATGKTGMIGRGQQFDGVDDYIPIPTEVKPNDDITVSAWIRIESVTQEFDEGIQIFATYRHNDLAPYGFELRTHMNDLVFVAGDGAPFDGAASWNVVRVMWMHVAAVYESGTGGVQMYIDGEAVRMDQPQTRPHVVYDSTGSSISAPVNFVMDGLIDELRIESLRRSPQWLRMCYENQKMRQTLVEL
jgi:hypothetical protein